MILIGLALGIAKGVRTVYMTMIIPNYVPIERLPYASGIQMVTNGIIIMLLGPLLGRTIHMINTIQHLLIVYSISGYIRDYSGSYNISIIVINAVTCITIVMWGVEYIYVKHISKPQNIKT